MLKQARIGPCFHDKSIFMTKRVFMTKSLVCAILSLGLFTGASVAAEAPKFAPHYMSLRPDQADLREGPSFAHKVLWVYRHRGTPLLVTASFDIWRRVQTPDGAVGWMSVAMLSDARTALVTGRGRVPLRESADPASKVTGLADPGAILGLKACTHDACRVAAQGIQGWIAKSRIWGAGADEIFR
jgi:SH3-like domain-containing protein